MSGVTGGRDMSFALLTTGGVRALGNNVNGELGDGTTARPDDPGDRLRDHQCRSTGRRSQPRHGLALLSDGTIKAWGLNANGQLGDGTRANRLTPVTVPGISNAIAIGAGAEHSLAVLADGTIRTWGRGYRGALGSGATTLTG